VENHGKHWIHLGHIISIDNTKTAVVKWVETLKKDTLHLGDCKKYNELDVISRKRKSTDFFCEDPPTKRGKPPPGQMKNMFFSNENLSKLCAEGVIQNLLSMLHFLTDDMHIFWELATSDLLTLMKSLSESYVPKAVLKPSLGIDFRSACGFYLRNSTFRPQKTERQAFSVFEALIESDLGTKFPLLISVESKLAHVVVVWREMVIDYESMHTYPLTKDT
jgi:hypothetical protein